MSENKITPIITPKAPAAVGPYSQGVAAGALIFVSGQIPLLADGTLLAGSVAEQTAQCVNNIEEVLQAVGLTLDAVVKTTVYMTDLGKFSELNAVYAQRFHAPFPARATVQVAALPRGAGVEIDAIAVNGRRQ